MKITGVETIILRYEVKNPVSDSLHTYDAGCTLVTKVLTDEGITGYASTYFGRIKSGPDTVKIIIDREFAPLLKGEDPFFCQKNKE